MSSHIPVMLRQAIEYLNVRPGLTYVDVTAGGGGHLEQILRLAGPSAKVIGIDRDPTALAVLKTNFADRVKLSHGNYSEISGILDDLKIDTVNGGILADLGVSSMQIDDPDRGFSFLKDGPLDMRMDPTAKTTAADLVNRLPEHDLANLIFKYGEEKHSRRIAKAIVQARPVSTTLQLVNLIGKTISWGMPLHKPKDTSHPATRTFQALRIAVNDELGSLEQFLASSLSKLSLQARLVVITFHSLEDRIVKQFLRKAAASCLCPPRQPVCTCAHKPELLIITRKPVVADCEEVLANPRSRSAKLRAGEKLA